MGQHSKTAVVYHYFEKDAVYRDNFVFFLARAWQADLDFFIVIAGEHSLNLPQRDNIRYIHADNQGHDFGSYATLVGSGALDPYDRLIFVNCTVRGPFLPNYATQSWTEPFLRQLVEDVHMCGATINILHDTRPFHALYRDRFPDDPMPFSHVQSSALAMTGVCFAFLKAQGLYAAAPALDKEGVVVECEIAMSQLVRGHGWNISSLLPPYGALDYRAPHSDINPATKTGHPQANQAYFGQTPHPYELVFIKTGWGLFSPGGLDFHTLMGLAYHPRPGLDWPGVQELLQRLADQIGGPLGALSQADQDNAAPAVLRSPRGPQQSCLMVLGMHRSGTSALAGALTLLGAQPPKTQMEPHFSNPKGFFESIPLRDFNDTLLAALGSSWKDWHPIDPARFATPRVQSMQDTAAEVLEAEFGAAPLFVLKDPRICRLLPFWRSVLDRRGIRLLPLHTHRNPHEVAGSLRSRYNFDPAFTQLLWLRHTLEAEAASRDQPRHFTSYDQLLEAPQGVVAGIVQSFGLPLNADTAAQDMKGFLSRDLRKHHAADAPGTGALAQWYRDSYDVFERWTEGTQQDTDQACLDRILTEFNHSVTVFAPILTDGRISDK